MIFKVLNQKKGCFTIKTDIWDHYSNDYEFNEIKVIYNNKDLTIGTFVDGEFSGSSKYSLESIYITENFKSRVHPDRIRYLDVSGSFVILPDVFRDSDLRYEDLIKTEEYRLFKELRNG